MSDLEKNKLNDEELSSVSGGTTHEIHKIKDALHKYEVVPDEMHLTDELVCEYLKNCFHVHAKLNRGYGKSNTYTLYGEEISLRRVLHIIKNNGAD